MKVKTIISDLKTDGAMPADCELSMEYRGDTELLKCKFDDLDLEISIPLYAIGMILGDEGHG